MKRYRVSVDGKVQGVGYRASVRARAEQAGLAGWVRNLPDGRVEAEIEGEQDAVEDLLTWMGEGPRWARVTGIEREQVDPLGETAFEVR